MKKIYIIVKKFKFPLILATLTFVFFYKIILHPNQMIFPAEDVLSIYSARKTFLLQSIKNYGEIPLWNPYIFSGQPFVSGEIGVFYPIHILFFLFPIDLAFGYVFVIDIFLIGLFTFLFAKKINLGNFGSLIAAIVIMFSGTTTLYLFPGHISLLDSIIWLPLLLLLYEYAITTKKLIYGVLSGITIAAMIFAGTIQIATYSIIVGTLYFTFRYFSENIGSFLKNLRIFISIPFLSFLTGISLAAIQLIPNLEFSRFSTRADGLSYGFASDFSLHPYQIITFLLPHFFGTPLIENTYWGINGNFWSLCGYAGILSLILALISILVAKNRLKFFFLFLTLFSLLFAIGRFGVVFPFLYEYVPGFNFFRVPARFLFIYGLSLSILAGMGASIFINTKSYSKYNYVFKKILLLLITAFIISIILIKIILNNKQDFFTLINSKGYALGNDLGSIYKLITQDLIVFTIIIAASSLIIFLKMKKLINNRYLKILILLALVADLWFFSIKFYDVKDPKIVFKNTEEINFLLKNNSYDRVFDFQGRFFSLMGKNHIMSVSGYDSMYLKDYRDFFWLSGNHANTPYESFFTFNNIRNLNILRLLNTKYILANKTAFAFDKTSVDQITPSLYKIKQTLPRAYIVPNAIVVKSRNELIKNLEDKNFDFKKYILLEKKPYVSILNSSNYKEANIISYKPNKIDIIIPMENPGFLVLSEIWYPGWKAFVNGKQTEIYKTNYIFRSIYLNKGLKNIAFIFDPLSYKIGKLISVSSLIIILLYIAFYIKRHKLKLK